MQRNRKFMFESPQLSRRRRRGATAVEFALVCPIVLSIMFGMIEISRMSTIIDSARTSVISGAREARVANATKASVIDEMEEMLDLFGIRDHQIQVTPSVITPSVTDVTIDIDVPFNASNGLYLVTLAGSKNLKFSVSVNR